MLPLMLNAAFTVLAKEGKENVTVTLESMTNCLQKNGVIILNSRSGSVYIRYNPGEHNLTAAGRPGCQLYISAPSGMHIYIEILAERTYCGFSVIASHMPYEAGVSYCNHQTKMDMHTNKKWIMSSDLVELSLKSSELTLPFLLHLRFTPVQPSYELQLHYDSPKQGK